MSESRLHSTQQWRKLALRTVKEEPIGCRQMARLLDQLNRLPDDRYRRLLNRILDTHTTPDKM